MSRSHDAGQLDDPLVTPSDDAGASDSSAAGNVSGPPDITVSVPRFALLSGQEIEDEFCEPLDNAGVLFVKGFDVRSGKGLHHTQVKMVTGQDGGTPERWLIGTTTGVANTSLFLPSKTVFQIPPYTTLCVGYHAINTTATELSVAIDLGLYLVPTADDQRIAAMMFAETSDIQLAAGVQTTVSFDCKVAEHIEIIALVPHTHERGTRFSVTRLGAGAGALVAEWNDLWDVSWRELTPVVALEPGDGLHVECDYQNTSTTAINYGTNARDEMCLLAAFYVPAAGTLSDVEQSAGCVVAPM